MAKLLRIEEDILEISATEGFFLRRFSVFEVFLETSGADNALKVKVFFFEYLYHAKQSKQIVHLYTFGGKEIEKIFS